MIQMNDESKEQISKLILQIHGFLPNWAIDGVLKNRTQRAILSPVGDVLSFLFGVSTQKETHALEHNLRMIKEFEAKQVKLLEHNARNMAGFSLAVNNKLEYLSTVLNERINETQLILQSLENENTLG